MEINEKQIGTVIAHDRWVLRGHIVPYDVARALRSSGIDDRSYLCCAPLDRLDVHVHKQVFAMGTNILLSLLISESNSKIHY